MRVAPPGTGPTSEPAVLVDGRYEIVSRLGEGGQAAVFGVLDRRLGVARALKALLPELANKPKMRTRFESEARTMAMLEHPNIVRVYDVSATGRSVYFVMEHVPGGNLNERIAKGGALPPRLAVHTIAQLCAGVSAAHAQGIVHRDIKPHNVLVAKDGTVKLMDFGIARTQDGHRTKAHAAMGTLGFVSPEQLMDARSVDGRADVYSLGVTLFVLVTGADPNEWLRRRRHDRLPEPLRVVVDVATRQEPEERHATVDAFAQAALACVPALPPDPEGASLAALPVIRREVEDTTPLAEVARWFEPRTGASEGKDTSEPADRAGATSWLTPGPSPAREVVAAARSAPPGSLPGDSEEGAALTNLPSQGTLADPTTDEQPRAAPNVPTLSVPAPPVLRPEEDHGGVNLRIFVWLGVLVVVVALFMAGAGLAVHQWKLAEEDDVRRVAATAALRRELDAQQATVTLLVSRGADGRRISELYDRFDTAKSEAERLSALEDLGAALHAEAERVLVEGTADATRAASSLRTLDRALDEYRETHPEVPGSP